MEVEVDDEMVTDAINDADCDGDGEVDFPEFIGVMKRIQRQLEAMAAEVEAYKEWLEETVEGEAIFD